jgi:predicted O-methyltransferase YrrM
MSSLTQPPVAGVLAQLFVDAQRTGADFHGRGSRRDHRPTGSPAGSREFFADARNVHLAVSPQTGRLLYFLARTGKARSVVEFGTSFGVSLIHLAAAVRDNGGGTVLGTEYESNKVQGARASAADAGLGDVVDIREGDALQTLAVDVPSPVDLLFLDGAKALYLDILQLLEPQLAPGALVIADNATRSPSFLAYIRNSDQYLSAGFEKEDLEISYRIPS